MTDLTHDTAEDGFHEIQLSGKQLVALFLVVTTVIVVVFLCGVKVGRGARDAQLDEPEQVAAASPAPQPTADERTRRSGAPFTRGRDPGAAVVSAATAGEGSTPDTLKKPEEASKSEDSKKPPAAARPAETRPQPAPVAASAPPPAAPATRTAAAPASDNLPTSGKPGTWAVQVIATRDRDIAGSVLKRLLGKGYPAFLVNPPANTTPAYFKVHVGRYADRGEAEKVSTRIKKEEQFPSWITR